MTPGTVNNYSFNGPVAATNFAVGDHATQHTTTITNIHVSEIRQAMQAVIDALPSLALEAVHNHEAAAAAAEAITHTDESPNDPGKLTRAARRVREIVSTSAKTALSTALTTMIDAALKKAGIP
jgi:hypothetical protein